MFTKIVQQLSQQFIISIDCLQRNKVRIINKQIDCDYHKLNMFGAKFGSLPSSVSINKATIDKKINNQPTIPKEDNTQSDNKSTDNPQSKTLGFGKPNNSGMPVNKLQKDQSIKIAGNEGQLKMGGTLFTNVPKQNSRHIAQIKEPSVEKKVQFANQERSMIEQIADQICFYSKIQKNQKLNQQNINLFIDSFKLLTDNQKERAQKLKIITQNKQEREKLMKISLINQQSDQIKTYVKLFFFQIIKQFFKTNQYISFSGVIELINMYLQTNKNYYYKNGSFQYSIIEEGLIVNTINPNSIIFRLILRQIQQIKTTIFNYYQKIFTLFTSLIKNKKQNQVLNQLKEPKYIKALSANIWNSFKNVISAQKLMQRQNRNVRYHQQINILMKGLNCCYIINNIYFERKLITEELTPNIIDLLPNFERNRNVHMPEIDKLILKLMLEKPYDAKSWDNNILRLLDDNKMERYSYLRVLHKANQSFDWNMEPLRSVQTTIFIQKLLLTHKQFKDYPSDQDGFIFQSICNILEDNIPNFKKFRRSQYVEIQKYIKWIQTNIQDITDYSRTTSILNVSKFCKLLNIITLKPTQKHKLNVDLNQITSNKYFIYTLFQNIFKILTMNSQDLYQINEELQYYSISTQSLYQFIFRLIILRSDYFNDKSDIVNQQYSNQEGFYLNIFVKYLEEFADNGEHCNVCILALTKLIENPAFNKITSKIIKQISNFQHTDLEEETTNSNNITVITKKNKLQYVLQNLFNNSKNYYAFADHLLMIFKHNQSLLKCSWINRISHSFKQISQKNHPYNIPEYGQLLIRCLQFLQQHPKSLQLVQQHFNFKFINKYLVFALSINFEDTRPYCKFIRTEMYRQIIVGVRLIITMTNLYLKERETGGENMVPYEVRKVIEMSNKNGDYQLQFKKQATSYSVALIILLLSREFTTIRHLRTTYPFLRQQIFQALINLNKIRNLFKFENELYIYDLFNKQREYELNKSLNLKQQIQNQIKRKPSYLGLQYLITWGFIGLDLKKQLFQKIKNIPNSNDAQSMKIKSHFIYVYWKQISKNQLKQAYKYIYSEIQKIKEFIDNRSQEQKLQNDQDVSKTMQNIFMFSLLLKSTSLQYYTEFVVKNHIFFFHSNAFNYETNVSEQIKLGKYYHQALITFFNCKSFLAEEMFQKIVKNQLFEKIVIFLKRWLQMTCHRKYNAQLNDVAILQTIEFGLSFLINLCQSSQQPITRLNTWLKNLYQILQQRSNKPQRMTTKQLLITLLIFGKLAQPLDSQNMNFSNDYWMLLLNVLQKDVRYASMIILDLQNIYNKHPLFFVSACHYLTEVAKTNQLSLLQTVGDYKNNKKLIQVLLLILNRAITGEKSYYVIWVIEIITQILHNQIIEHKLHLQYFSKIKMMILSNKFYNVRLQELLGKLSTTYGIKPQNLFKFNSNERQSGRGILMSEKLQLMAMLRLLALIKLHESNQQVKFSSLYFGEQTLQYLFLREDSILETVLNMIPLLNKLLSTSDIKLQKNSEWQSKLSGFDVSNLMTHKIMNSGLKHLQQNDLQHIWGNPNALDLVQELSNIDFIEICTLWISSVVQRKLSQISFHSLLQSDGFESITNSILKLMESVVKKACFYTKYYEKIEQIFDRFQKEIWRGSVQLSKEMMFTNSQTLSCSLTTKFEDCFQKIIKCFEILYKISKIVQQSFEKGRNKNQIKFKKQFKHILKEAEPIQKNIQKYFSDFRIRQQDLQKTQNNSLTKSKTIKMFH